MTRSRLAERSIPARVAYPVALACGVLLAGSFPEPDVAPLAWVALSPLLLVLDRAGWKRGFGLGSAFGLGFFGVLLYWISIVGVLAYALLLVLQVSFVAAFGAAWGAISSRLRSGIAGLAGPVLLWVAVVEFLRANLPLRGFPWGQLAQSQAGVPHLLRTAGLGGSWLLAALLVAINALLARLVLAEGRRARVGCSVGAVALLLAPFAIPAPSAEGPSIRVAIVQGNVPRDMPPGRDKQLTILRSHARLTATLPEVDLVVWPESSVGIDPEREPDIGRVIAAAARAADAPMIVGGNLDLPPDRYKVMAFLVSAEGAFVDRYQKTHLVPFGEYVPGRELLDWIPALDQVPTDAVPADVPVVFEVAGGSIAPVISFEGDFGSLVRERIAAGGRMLVVATNTSTWGFSWASAQHVAMSRLRAAENGVPVIHGALSGISAFIDPGGRVIERTSLWTAEVLVRDVAFATTVTPYARMGDWVAYLSLVGAVLLALAAARRSPSDTVPR